jgi:PRC-barrel domain protein
VQVISTEELMDMVASGTGTVVGSAGESIGRVAQVFLDDQTGRPEWVTAKAGMFSGESFIPVAQASLNGNELAVPFAEDEIKDAPRVRGEAGHLSEAEEARLYAYYGLNCSDIAS